MEEKTLQNYYPPEVSIVELTLCQVITASPEAGESEGFGFENW